MAPRGSLNPKPKPIFRGVVVATAGDLGDKMSAPNLIKWLRNYGGRLSADLDETVTHLVATDEQFNKKVQRVREAMHNKIFIVQPDWLDDCMAKNKKMPIDNYSHMKIRKAENEKRRRSEKRQKGIEQGVSYINSNKYHIYMDSTGFSHQVTLTREEGERFIVELWESNSKPQLYYAAVKYHKKAGAKGITHRPSETPGSLKREFKIFCLTFLKKTGVVWDDRLKNAKANNGVVTGPGGNKHGGYRYEMPARGPFGLIDGKNPGPVTFSSSDDDEQLPSPVATGAVQIFGNASKDNDHDAQAEDLPLALIRDFTYGLGATDSETQHDATGEDTSIGKQRVPTPPISPKKQIRIVLKDQDKPPIAREDTSIGKQCVPTSPVTPKQAKIVLKGQDKPPIPGQFELPHTNDKPAWVTSATANRSAPKNAANFDIPGIFHRRPSGTSNMHKHRTPQSSATGAAQKVLASRNEPVDEKRLLLAKTKVAPTNACGKVKNSGVDIPNTSHRVKHFDLDIEMDDAVDDEPVAVERASQDSDAETDGFSDDSIPEVPRVDKAAGIVQMIEQGFNDGDQELGYSGDDEEQMTESEDENDSSLDD